MNMKEIKTELMLQNDISEISNPFDPTKVKSADVTLPAEERPIGGLGIFLIKSLMTEMRYQYKEGKNILTLVKTIG